MLKHKIRTQKGLILKKMIDEPSRWFIASEFCGGSDDCPFIGYKAPTRIAEMSSHNGGNIILRRWSSKTTILGDKLMEYKINIEFFNFINTNNSIIVQKRIHEQRQLI